MDSHSFRIIAGEMLSLADGARIENIHGPHPETLVLTLFAGGVKRRLVFRYERKNPLLFFTNIRLTNPPRPPGVVMLLRKYCSGRRLGRGMADYASRRIAFPVATDPKQEPVFLMLDMVTGAHILKTLPEGFGSTPAWPGADLAASLCGQTWRKGETDGPWKEFAVLTPQLRETLADLVPLEGQALLADLEAGGGDLFFYASDSATPVLYAAWPFSSAMLARRRIREYSTGISGAVMRSSEAIASLFEDYPALAGVSLVDEARFFAEYSRELHKSEAVRIKRTTKKQTRLLTRLDQEQKRLAAMAALREDAIALQQTLWAYPAEARLAEVQVPVPDLPGQTRICALDPRLTVRENMARMFHQSARGARGLARLKERHAEALAGMLMQDAGQNPPLAPSFAPSDGPPGNTQTKRLPQALPSSYKDVSRFLSSDGYTLLRGKNAKGNQSLLKIGKAHDLWLHAEDGPSAHLIIRRSHAKEEVPERTLLEAGTLVGEKSWRKDDSEAHIMVAVLRHVHPIKGASPGTVKVDALLDSLCVTLVGGVEQTE